MDIWRKKLKVTLIGHFFGWVTGVKAVILHFILISESNARQVVNFINLNLAMRKGWNFYHICTSSPTPIICENSNWFE